MFKYVIVVILFCYSTVGSATENLYIVVSSGYSQTEVDSAEADGAGFKFGVGYQFHRQWYLELGFQYFADESLQTALPSEQAGIDAFQPGLESNAMFVALLGKASNPVGELFYRVGAMRVDNRGQALAQNAPCQLGEVSAQAQIGNNTYLLCDYDKAALAGVIGLGFDYFIGNRSMLRTEVEYISGENDFEAASLVLGYRYNF